MRSKTGLRNVEVGGSMNLKAIVGYLGALVVLIVAGHDLQLVLVREDGTAPEQADEAFSARITLRLPESLKQRVESAAAREGASVNTWLVQALARAVESRRGTGGSRNRLTGYGQN